jgi:hypothetical protein
MTGRSVHDGLLRALTSAHLRRQLAAADPRAAAALGAEEAAVLRAADPLRLARLARFMARHFYRERIVRLFAASRLLARGQGVEALAVLDTPAFGALLDEAEVGSSETAERVAGMVEAALAPPLAGLDHGRDLLRYEGMLFRAEAGPRRWRESGPDGGVPVRSSHARLVALEWDVTPLVAAVRRGDPALPAVMRGPTRLLVTLGPSGRVTALRCPEPLERLLGALDGVRSVREAAASAGVGEAEARQALDRLAEVGAVEWARTTG